LSDADLDEYEAWLEVPDQQIFSWVNGTQTAPAEIDTPLFRRLCDFHHKGESLT
jgi:antitoxin CptB